MSRVLALSLLLPATAHADWYVDSDGCSTSHTTLAAALAAAAATDTVYVDLAGDSDGGVVAPAKTITIAPKDPATCAVDPGNLRAPVTVTSSPLLDLPSGGSYTLFRLDIAGGVATGNGGNLYARDGSTLRVERTVVRDGSASDGGGLYAETGTTVVLDGAWFLDNAATGDGGGVFAENVTLDDALFVGNTADRGAGLFAVDVFATDTEFSDNVATNRGGGLYATKLAATGGSLSRNTSGDFGGGAFLAGGASSFTSTTFKDNDAFRGGGAVWTQGDLDLEKILAKDNDASVAGAFGVQAATLEIVDSDVEDNTATNFGGAVLGQQNASVVVALGRFRRNEIPFGSITAGGGAIAVEDASTLTVTHSLFSNNRADQGGALWSQTGLADVRDSEFRSNQSLLTGGAIRALQLVGSKLLMEDNNTGAILDPLRLGGTIWAIQATLDDVTIRRSSAGWSGGAIWASDLTLSRGTFESNAAQVSGGAIFVDTGAVIGTNAGCTTHPCVTFLTNDAPAGGDVYGDDADLDLGRLFDRGSFTNQGALVESHAVASRVFDLGDSVFGDGATDAITLTGPITARVRGNTVADNQGHGLEVDADVILQLFANVFWGANGADDVIVDPATVWSAACNDIDATTITGVNQVSIDPQFTIVGTDFYVVQEPLVRDACAGWVGTGIDAVSRTGAANMGAYEQ
jgi:predicted outer membrane repeat protein